MCQGGGINDTCSLGNECRNGTCVPIFYIDIDPSDTLVDDDDTQVNLDRFETNFENDDIENEVVEEPVDTTTPGN